MAERIIYRGRPRATKPYPFEEEVSTIPNTNNFLYLGPLTLDELMEFKYRIKNFSISGSVTKETTDDEGDTINETEDFSYDIGKGIIESRFSSSSPFFFSFEYRTYMYEKESEFTVSFVDVFNRGQARDSFYAQSDWTGSFYIYSTLNFADNKSPLKTNEGYFLPLYMDLLSYPDSSTDNNFEIFSVLGKEQSEPEAEIGVLFYFNAQLKVGSKTYSIRVSCASNFSTLVSASLTIEATEWWPYANADGQPIWDTSTGARTSNPFT